MSCLWIDREKHVVLRVKRLIRIRKPTARNMTMEAWGCLKPGHDLIMTGIEKDGADGLTRRNPVDDPFAYHEHRGMGTP
jgi:hypothetical protein